MYRALKFKNFVVDSITPSKHKRRFHLLNNVCLLNSLTLAAFHRAEFSGICSKTDAVRLLRCVYSQVAQTLCCVLNLESLYGNF